MSQLETKASLRERLFRLRAELSEDEVIYLGGRVVSRAVEYLKQRPCRNVGLYASHGHEVPTRWLADWLRAVGGTTCYPRWEGGDLLFLPVTDEARMAVGSFGIREPKGTQVEQVSGLDCLVIPGIVFDERGYRIGFGKGCYDRTLRGYAGLKMGLAFELQIVGELPQEAHDVPCDVIVTEDRVIIAGKR